MSIDVGRADPIGWVTLNRPNKLNAMTDTMWARLAESLTDLDADPDIAVIVLRGAGGNFCSGSDVSTLVSADPLPDRMRVSNLCVLMVAESDTPVIAQVSGVAAGAGANLALACDLVIASTDSRFIQLFMRRGLTLDSGGSWLLPRLVGNARARELALLSEEVGGHQALEWGLVNRVVDVDELDRCTQDVALRLATANPMAVAATKRLLRAGTHTDLATALEAEIAEQVSVIETAAGLADGFADRPRANTGGNT
jgi:2-(1,2-epoxy-1,2-dihydrophenyl)acetyl-CoA isomerase